MVDSCLLYEAGLSMTADINMGGWKLPGIESQNSWVLYLRPSWLLGFGHISFLDSRCPRCNEVKTYEMGYSKDPVVFLNSLWSL